MRISGTEPSSVILSQTMKFKKLKSDDPKVPKQAEAKRDSVTNCVTEKWKIMAILGLKSPTFQYKVYALPQNYWANIVITRISVTITF